LKKTFSYIFIFLILTSCNNTEKKNSPNIEIYLTKNRIQSNQGIEINSKNIDSFGYKKVADRFDFDIVRLDTMNSALIFAGEFVADKKDLNSEPLLSNKNILEFNSQNGFLKVDSIGAKKIKGIDAKGYGTQFVLTINKEPKLFGYFYSYPFSYYCHTYNYDYVQTSLITEFKLNYGMDMYPVDLEKEKPELYKTLNNNGN
jgi:hypothetical protein